MAPNRSTWRRSASYLVSSIHLKSILYVLAGGYAAGLFAWELVHRDRLASYVFTNQIAPDARAHVLPLGLPMLIAVAIWLGASALVSVAAGRRLERTLDQGSGLFLALSLLAFIPLLAVDRLETKQPLLILGAIAAMAAIAWAAAQQVVGDASGEPAVKSPALSNVSGPHARDLGANRAGLIATVLLALGYTVYMSLLTIARHNAFMTHSFDLGIHDQAMYTLLHLGYMRSTQYGAEVINYIGDHFSPIFYLLAPLYAIHQDARTLLVLQSLALGLGAIPVFLLAHDKTKSPGLGLALAISYLLYPALHGVNTFDFHQIALVVPLLLFSLYFLESGEPSTGRRGKKDWAFLVTLALALMVKEEVALTIAAIGLYVLFLKKRRRLGAVLVGVGLAYFLVVTQVVMPALGGTPQVNRFAGMIAPGSEGLPGVIKTLATNPFFTLYFIFSNPERMAYIVQMLLPVLFLPLLGGAAWIMAVPAVSVALLTAAETQYSIAYHYSAIIIPCVFFLAILGITKLKARPGHRAGVAAGLLMAGLAMNYSYGWIFSKNSQALPARNPHAAQVEACLQGIPRGASASAMSDLVPHLSARETIYLFPIVNGADYIVFDSDPRANFWPFEGPSARLDAISSLIPYVKTGEYGLHENQDGCVLLKRGADTSQNSEAVKTLLSAKYEAETLRTDFASQDLRDDRASEGMARVARPSIPREEGKNALTFGPYMPLFPGKYAVSFRLRLDGKVPDGPVATVDVFSNAAGGELAGRDISAADFKAGGAYQDFPVEVEIRDLLPDLEFRVIYKGVGDLWADVIQITPISVATPTEAP